MDTGAAVGWPYGVPGHLAPRSAGWVPTPFRQFVLKVRSRCNLSCTYCYVYSQVDESWRDQPVAMSEEIVTVTAGKILDHAQRHGLESVEIVLHGGEPLLAGADSLRAVARTFRDVVEPFVSVQFSVQTNGTLMSDRILEACLAENIQVGVSLDGALTHHNRRRPRHDGADSLRETTAGLHRLTSARFRPVFAGLLGVIDPLSDPLEVYESLLTWEPPAVDFLLPHGNWTVRPPGRPADEQLTPYADWLVPLFDRWYDAAGEEVEIRIFQEIMVLLLGGHSRLETVGLSPSTVIVVESDGSIEQVDALKSAYHGAASTGLNVLNDGFDQALRHPGVIARQIGRAALGEQCGECRVRNVCGGGFYPHRYRRGDGFRNRSVYCPDLLALITHIDARVRHDLERARVHAR